MSEASRKKLNERRSAIPGKEYGTPTSHPNPKEVETCLRRLSVPLVYPHRERVRNDGDTKRVYGVCKSSWGCGWQPSRLAPARVSSCRRGFWRASRGHFSLSRLLFSASPRQRGARFSRQRIKRRTTLNASSGWNPCKLTWRPSRQTSLGSRTHNTLPTRSLTASSTENLTGRTDESRGSKYRHLSCHRR
jgi:hypothetical protein